jgi:hypothetical protein
MDRIGDEAERASGDAASARLFARVRTVEYRDARASPREDPGCASARRAPAHDRDVTRAAVQTDLAHLPYPTHLTRVGTVIHYTAMVEVDAGRFTVGVFQDAVWAAKGIAALIQAGMPAESLTVLAKDAPEAAALLEQTLGAQGARLDIAGVGTTVLRGPMVDALQGNAKDLARLGLAGTMRRVGFQAHDGRIFEALVARGGILVSVHSEPRAADALAVLLSYGGGNAAIGAWTGRV